MEFLLGFLVLNIIKEMYRGKNHCQIKIISHLSTAYNTVHHNWILKNSASTERVVEQYLHTFLE